MTKKTAEIWRMQTDQHICPYGLKSKDLLKKKGFAIEDHLLTSRAEVDRFKEKHNVKTTPQTWIEKKLIGGYDDLRSHFNIAPTSKMGSKYTPVIAIFATASFASLAINHTEVFTWETLLTFVALSMVILAIQKLQDLESFSMQFITYDLLAMRKIRYAYVYPFAEAYTGIGMLSEYSPWLFAPVGIFIGTVGAVSVIKAVYIDKRELKCACVGGNSEVPLGFISLTENLFMIGAGLAMLVF